MPAPPAPTLVSDVPGRLRVRSSVLATRGRAQALLLELEEKEEVERLEHNPRAKSLRVFYRAGLEERERVLALVSAHLGEVHQASELEKVCVPLSERLGRISLPRVPLPKVPLQAARDFPGRGVNRIAKLGGLGSLGISLGALAAGNKKLHARSGYVFVGLLALHVLRTRKQLLR